MNEHNLLAGNTIFQKRRNSQWTWRSPTNSLFQIDYILCKKRWRNSLHDCQAHSSSDPVGSDHRIVVTKCKLSLRSRKKKPMQKLDWKKLDDQVISNAIDEQINVKWNNCKDKSYTKFAEISLNVCKENLPLICRVKTNEPALIAIARSQVLSSSIAYVQANQLNLRTTYNNEEEKRINRILDQADKSESTDGLKNAWNLVKELSGKKKSKTVFIKSDDRLKSWKNHFESLLNNNLEPMDNDADINTIFPLNDNIPTGDFTVPEIESAIKQMKLGKAAGLDGLPLEFWRKHFNHLLEFCNVTLNGNRPPEWGCSAIVPVPKKGDLTKVDNYRGISLTQVAAKVYNRLILNRIRPEIDKILRFNQNGFRPSRSTSSQIMALRRIIEEMKNHNLEAVITFIDFRKAFDSINRSKMFKILLAYSVPPRLVEGIKLMYTDNKATVMTSEGETDFFKVLTGVLQGDPLAPYLFVIVLDYALRIAVIEDQDGITLRRRKSRRHPADIALLSCTIQAAEELLHRLQTSRQIIGLSLNAKKTQLMHLNSVSNDELKSIDGSDIVKVEDFKYLGAYTDTCHDIDIRLAQAWSALNALDRVWKTKVSTKTKITIFKATVESILLYSCESWSLTATLSKKVDGSYTRMLRKVKNIPPSSHITNRDLYGDLPPVSSLIQKRRLQLAGHVLRGNEPATKLLLWEPEVAQRKRGRPRMTLKKVIERDTGMRKDEIVRLANDRVRWRELTMSSLKVDV